MSNVTNINYPTGSQIQSSTISNNTVICNDGITSSRTFNAPAVTITGDLRFKMSDAQEFSVAEMFSAMQTVGVLFPNQSLENRFPELQQARANHTAAVEILCNSIPEFKAVFDAAQNYTNTERKCIEQEKIIGALRDGKI